MVFQVPASKKSKGQDRFDFELDGKSYSVKRSKFLSVGEQEIIGNGGVTEMIDTVFGARGTELGDAIRELDEDQYVALIEAYNADSGVTPGESAGSAE